MKIICLVPTGLDCGSSKYRAVIPAWHLFSEVEVAELQVSQLLFPSQQKLLTAVPYSCTCSTLIGLDVLSAVLGCFLVVYLCFNMHHTRISSTIALCL